MLQAARLEGLKLDIAVLTEPGVGCDAHGARVVSPAQRPGSPEPESWVAVHAEGAQPVGNYPFERLAAAAVTTTNGRELIVYGSVLPWRSVKAHAAYILQNDESPSAAFRRLLDEQLRDLEQLHRDHPGASLSGQEISTRV
jgi:hypothetical protein